MQSFLPMMFRMRHIYRWGRMYNTQPESLSLHSAECAFLSHFLASIGNVYLNKNHDADRIAAAALYHDATEIMTGDLPTPVKYFNDTILTAYKGIEEAAASNLLDGLPPEMRSIYSDLLLNRVEEEVTIIKAADKLCAYIKCINEVTAGNKEFEAPLAGCRNKVMAMAEKCPELKIFMERFFYAFTLPLDELKIHLLE